MTLRRLPLLLLSLTCACTGAVNDPDTTTDAGTADASTADAGSPGTKAIGDACASSSECAGGDRAACGKDQFGYKDGYCFLEGCATDAECPTGAHCAYADAETNTKGLCFKDCKKDSDCRTDGYLCLDVDQDNKKECESGATGTGLVGTACSRIYQCAGGADGFCSEEREDGSFKGGYCSLYCGDDAACGFGNHCAYMVGGGGACLVTCTKDADCRGSGWTCSDADDDGVKECDVYGPTPVGGACASDADCSGGANRACIPASKGVMKDGYCTVERCSADLPCPSGSHCGFVDEDTDEGRCVADCTAAAGCRGAGYACFDADGDSEKECWGTGNGAKAVGDACAGLWECTGGNNARCLGESGGTFRQGYCSVNCTTSSGCAAGSHCSVGTCMKDCAGDGDCRPDGYRCYDEGGDGKKECAAAGTGSLAVGAACTGVWECAGADKAYCYGKDDGFPGGYCFVAPCNATNACPTGSHCADKNASGNGRCLASCAASTDCRTGYVCKDKDNDAAKECVGG